MHPFTHLKYFLLFIGYRRSGHSLIGSLLDAHPHMIIAHEYNLLKKLKNHQGKVIKSFVLNGICENSQGYRDQRIQGGYDYTVLNQHQGTYKEPLTIIGDKKGHRTTNYFIRDNDKYLYLLLRFQETINLPLKLLHVIRNPWDNIATIALHDYCLGRNIAYKDQRFSLNNPLVMDEILGRSINSYFANVKKNIELMNMELGSYHIIYSEDFIANPKYELQKICTFLEQEAEEDYLSDCASIVMKKPKKTRNFVRWHSENVEQVINEIQHYPLLQKYCSTSPMTK